jgi:hypothetical protein
MDELEARIELSFAVFPETSALLQPSEGSLDDPALGDHGEGV